MGRQGGARSHLLSRNFKAELCVVIGGGGDQGVGRGLRISHILSRNVKAEFCVNVGGGGS